MERQESGLVFNGSQSGDVVARQYVVDTYLQVGHQTMGRDSGGLWSKITKKDNNFYFFIQNIFVYEKIIVTL